MKSVDSSDCYPGYHIMYSRQQIDYHSLQPPIHNQPCHIDLLSTRKTCSLASVSAGLRRWNKWQPLYRTLSVQCGAGWQGETETVTYEKVGIEPFR